MFNRTLNRPMFRRGGRAGGGIMTGVETPKRGQVDGPGSYAGDENDYGGGGEDIIVGLPGKGLMDEAGVTIKSKMRL